MAEPMLEGFVDSWGPFNPAAILGESFNNARQPEMAMWPNVNRVNTQGSFKAPPLRHVARTGPYFHNGGKLTLRQVVDFYTRGGDFPHSNAAHRDFLIVNLLDGGRSSGRSGSRHRRAGVHRGRRKRRSSSAWSTSSSSSRTSAWTTSARPFDQPEIFVPLDGTAPDNGSLLGGVAAGRPGFLNNLANGMFQQVPPTGQGGTGSSGRRTSSGSPAAHVWSEAPRTALRRRSTTTATEGTLILLIPSSFEEGMSVCPGREEMHRIGLALIFALLAGVGAAGEEPALKDERAKNSYAVGVDTGQRLKATPVELDPELVARGVRDALRGDKTLLTEEELKAVLAALRIELRTRHEQALKSLGETNKKEGEAFLAENRTREGVVTLESGLQYRVLKAGEGRKPAADDSVLCHYRGTLIDGQEFDSSLKRNRPATFHLQKLIKGWSEALQLMPVGSKWQIFIPPDLAYGERGSRGAVGPNATLVFEVELLSIEDKARASQQSPEPSSRRHVAKDRPGRNANP